MGEGNRLIEPFVGSAAVFINANYKRYLLADSNPDLIALYHQLIEEETLFIDFTDSLFSGEFNNADSYYQLREEFNSCEDPQKRAALFVYLNRHCYNGLCRYNSKGIFNTPFGRYKNPKLPRKEMLHFVAGAKNARFECADYQDTMNKAKAGDIIYCDPPYVPLSATAYFTDYHVGGFNWDDQILLADKAANLAEKGIRTVISNHATREIRKLYKQRQAKITAFDVRRTISCNAHNRNKVRELLAVFG